jgi:hypothetical protein
MENKYHVLLFFIINEHRVSLISMKRKYCNDNVITYNISVKKFTISRDTICSKPETKLAKLIFEQEKINVNSINLQYYFDKNPIYFGFILEWYRIGVLPMFKITHQDLESFYNELDYWQISISPTYEILKNAAFHSNIKSNVCKFFDEFLKEDVLISDKTRRSHNLFLQDYPMQIINTMCQYDPADGNLNIMELNIFSGLNRNIQGDIKSLMARIGKANNLPLDDLEHNNYSERSLEIMSKNCKNIKNLHPVINAMYECCFFQTISDMENTLEILLPKELISIISPYVQNDSIYSEDKLETHYLPYALTLFGRLLSGADLFDNDNDLENSLFARSYAINYFASKGIKAEWKQRNIKCNSKDDENDGENDSLYSSYPFSMSRFDVNPKPFYKCSICSLKNWSLLCPSHTFRKFDIWYLSLYW